MKSLSRKSALTLMVVVTAAVGSSAVFAQFRKPSDAVKYRKAIMTLMGTHAGRIYGQLKSDKPDLQAIQSSAALLAVLDDLPWEAFGKDTAQVESKAKPGIWTEPEKFKAAADKLMASVDKLNVAAKSGDIAATKTAFGATGESCDGCHDAYQAK